MRLPSSLWSVVCPTVSYDVISLEIPDLLYSKDHGCSRRMRVTIVDVSGLISTVGEKTFPETVKSSLTPTLFRLDPPNEIRHSGGGRERVTRDDPRETTTYLTKTPYELFLIVTYFSIHKGVTLGEPL